MSSSNVTVVIPTVLRPELRDAIGSVRRQTSGSDAEVIVVVDRAEAECTAEELNRADGATDVIFTGGRLRAGHARNLGVSRASNPWVGFLDDDDEWLPERLGIHAEDQRIWASSTRPVVFSTRVMQSVRASRDPAKRVTPDAVISSGQSIQDYLFRSRKPSIGRAGMFTSTLIVPTDLAKRVRWDESLSRHQDWDWLYRLQRDGGAQMVQSTAPGAIIWIGSGGSISATADWAGSLAWVRKFRNEWDAQTYTDFVAGQSLRYATQARSLSGVKAASAELWRTRRRPSLGPLLMGVGGIVPRGAAVKVVLRAGKRSGADSTR